MLSLGELEKKVSMSKVFDDKFLIEIRYRNKVYRCRSNESVVYDCLTEKSGNILTRQEALQSAYNECKIKNNLK